MIFWLSVLAALIAAALIGGVLLKHWKEIRLLDPDTIRAEQERQVRDRLVQQRFDRRLKQALGPLQKFGRGAGERMLRTYRQVEERLARMAALEKPQATFVGDAAADSLQLMLTEARDLAREYKWAEAERAYLEVLKHDPRQLDAYRGLAALYLAQKLYPQAKETFKFLERIHGDDDACYAGLAEIAEAEGDLVTCEALRRKAVERSPRNAVRHAELASFYLAHGSPEYAWQAARKASDLEPETPRFLELSLEAAILLRDRGEAERRYDRLRLLDHDRQKLQVLREKLDAMPGK